MARECEVSKQEFDQICSDYIGVAPQAKAIRADICAEIQELIDQGRNNLSRPQVGEVRRLARLIIEVLPVAQLQYRALQIIDNINAIAPGNKSSLVGDASRMAGWSEELQRAYVVELQKLRVSLSIAAEYGAIRRFQLLGDIAKAGLFTLATLALAFVGFAGVGIQSFAVMSLIGFWGALGAVISLTTRVRDLDASALARDAQLFQATDWTLLLGPAFGAIGSILAVLAIIGGVITSKLLDFDDVSALLKSPGNVAGGWTYDNFVFNLRVVADGTFSISPSVIVIYIVSLVAGRSERLIVDTLDLVERKFGSKT